MTVVNESLIKNVCFAWVKPSINEQPAPLGALQLRDGHGMRLDRADQSGYDAALSALGSSSY
jgi:hypothetical protein